MSIKWELSTENYISGATSADSPTFVGAGLGRDAWLNFSWTKSFDIPAGVIKKLRLRFRPTTVWLELPFQIRYSYGEMIDHRGYRHITDLHVSWAYGRKPVVPLGVTWGGSIDANQGWDEEKQTYVVGLAYWWWAYGFRQQHETTGNIYLYPNGCVSATGEVVAPLSMVVPDLGTYRDEGAREAPRVHRDRTHRLWPEVASDQVTSVLGMDSLQRNASGDDDSGDGSMIIKDAENPHTTWGAGTSAGVHSAEPAGPARVYPEPVILDDWNEVLGRGSEEFANTLSRQDHDNDEQSEHDKGKEVIREARRRARPSANEHRQAEEWSGEIDLAAIQHANAEILNANSGVQLQFGAYAIKGHADPVVVVGEADHRFDQRLAEAGLADFPQSAICLGGTVIAKTHGLHAQGPFNREEQTVLRKVFKTFWPGSVFVSGATGIGRFGP